MPDNFIDCCVTSPPYWGLRDYGTAKWEGGDASCDHKIPDVEHDPKRGMSDSVSSHTLRFNKTNCYKCGAIRIDNQLGLEKTPEEYVARMVEVFREVKRVLKPEGTLWLNLGDSYVSSPAGNFGSGTKPGNGGAYRAPKPKMNYPQLYKPKDLVGIPWLIAFALRADGWFLRQDIIWSKPNPMPESVTDRCTKSHEYIFLMAKSQKYYYNNEAIKESYQSLPEKPRNRASEGYNESFSGGRFSPGERDYYGNGGRNKRSVWTISTKPFKESHFATFPEDLIIPCVLAGCQKDGIILDPFMGAGTLGVVAVKSERNFIGIELNPEYVTMAENRIEPYLNQGRLAL